MKVCLDTYALVEIEKRSPAYQHITQEEFVITSAAMGEFYYLLAKKHGLKTAEYWANKLLLFTKSLDTKTWLSAMRYRFRRAKDNISIVDALGYAYAQGQGLPFVTGDQAFKDEPGVKFIS